MNLNEKEQLRRVLLLILENPRYAQSIGEIRNLAELRDFKNPENELVENLEWLVCKGFVEESRTGMSRLKRAWKITDLGIEYLDSVNA